MSRGIYVALSGAVAQETALESTAANLANATTTGYQAIKPVFREVLANTTKKAGSTLHETTIDTTSFDHTRGALRTTGRSLDIALPENTYLAVTTPRGERYTRGGSLKVASDGSLQTSTGATVAGEDGKPIKVDPTKQTAIAPDGSVMQEDATVSHLRLVKLEKGTTMTREGSNLLAAQGGTPTATSGQLDVGALEESNATVVGSMTDLVTASRTFEAFQKMLDQFGEIDRKVLTTVPTATEAEVMGVGAIGTASSTASSSSSSARQVEPKRTPVTQDDIRGALARAHVAATGKAASGATLDVLTAQASLETASGSRMYNYNFGGIKGASASGATAQLRTHEVLNGKDVEIKDGFRAYSTIDEGATDYVRLMKQRFPGAMQQAEQGNTDGFAHALKKSGYYTADENAYASGLRSLMGTSSTASSGSFSLNAMPALPNVSSMLGVSSSPQDFANGPSLNRMMDAIGHVGTHQEVEDEGDDD